MRLFFCCLGLFLFSACAEKRHYFVYEKTYRNGQHGSDGFPDSFHHVRVECDKFGSACDKAVDKAIKAVQ